MTQVTACPTCDGMGEWDEGPINCGSPAPVDPIYRQVKCPDCDGAGKAAPPPEPKPHVNRDADDVRF